MLRPTDAVLTRLACVQTEESIQRLETDAGFRQEYTAQWEQARPKAEAAGEPAGRGRGDPAKVSMHSIDRGMALRSALAGQTQTIPCICCACRHRCIVCMQLQQAAAGAEAMSCMVNMLTPVTPAQEMHLLCMRAQALAQADREVSKSRAEQLIAEALEQARTSLAQSRSSGALAESANGTASAGKPICCQPYPPPPHQQGDG